jgi:2-keto-myo-inositol isomerase
MVHLNDAPAKAPREIEDSDRLLPGRGVIRLKELVGTLRAAGYSGPWSLETFNPDYWALPPVEIATEGHAAMTGVLAAPADTA